MKAEVGDVIEVRSVQVGQRVRRGTVKEVLGTDPLELRVEWGDGHESVFFPRGDMAHVLETSES